MFMILVIVILEFVMSGVSLEWKICVEFVVLLVGDSIFVNVEDEDGIVMLGGWLIGVGYLFFE